MCIHFWSDDFPELTFVKISISPVTRYFFIYEMVKQLEYKGGGSTQNKPEKATARFRHRGKTFETRMETRSRSHPDLKQSLVRNAVQVDSTLCQERHVHTTISTTRIYHPSEIAGAMHLPLSQSSTLLLVGEASPAADRLQRIIWDAAAEGVKQHEDKMVPDTGGIGNWLPRPRAAVQSQ